MPFTVRYTLVLVIFHLIFQIRICLESNKFLYGIHESILGC